MSSLGSNQRKVCVSKSDTLSLKRQSELLSVTRKCVYYIGIQKDIPVNLLNSIDRIYTESPYFGQRRIRITLSRDYRIEVGRWMIRRAMNTLGIQTLYPRKNTSIPNVVHKKYPYLLKWLKIERINQVWGCDITYIRLEHGWVYLVAIIDWYSRKTLAWKVSTTMDVRFYVDCLTEAVEVHGKPEIFNTDQGSQFTSEVFTGTLKWYEIKISMDGKGRWVDNVFTERLWRSLKQNEVYRNAYVSPLDAFRGISAYFRKYNSYDPHQSLGYKTPDEVYYGDENVKRFPLIIPRERTLRKETFTTFSSPLQRHPILS